jgi:hypothetical protein
VAAKPSGKITTKQKPSGVFTGRDNAKFTAMSALPPKADMHQHGRDVRFVPKADIGSCPDHIRFTLESGRFIGTPCQSKAAASVSLGSTGGMSARDRVE